MIGLKTHLARRLMVYISGSVFCALLITIATQFWAIQPILEDTRTRNVEAALDNLASLVAQSLWVFNEENARDTANAMLRDQFISGIVINDHDRLFEYRIGDLADSSHYNPEIDSVYRNLNAKALTVVAPLLIESENGSGRTYNVGSLEIHSNNQLISQMVNRLTLYTLLSSVLIILALQFIFHFLVQTIVAKPLNELSRYVQSLASNLSASNHTIAPTFAERSDEIGRLAQTFYQQRMELIDRERALRGYRDHLEQTVSERTKELSATNASLVESLDQLKKAQAELIQNEKLVSLGALVSGIAHEVNTPVGIAITAASHLGEELRLTRTALNTNKLTKSGFESFLNECHDSEVLLTNNLNRAATLIQSFKQVAVDQSSEEERTIDLKSYINEILVSLRPRLKMTSIEIDLDVPDGIALTIAPGALAQIVTNLVMNSIIHGFNKGADPGAIRIVGAIENDKLTLTYADNGIGMDEKTLKRVYDPFFTTRRSEGGSGLGMNIVYNLVTSKLNGSIETYSALGEGLKIIMTIKI